MPSWITDERVRLYPRAVFAALVAAFVITVASADGAATVGGALGGDYAAFHGAGTLVLQGQGHALYDAAAQAEVQRALHPDEPGNYLYFVYPPVVALLYAPLAALGFVAGYVLHTSLAAAALWGAVRMLRVWLPSSVPAFAQFVGLLTFYPLMRAVFGGQNTSLSLFVITAAAALGHRQRPVAAGAVAACLLAKPQFGVPVVALMVLREPRTLLGAVPVAAALYSLCVAVAGPGWVQTWLSHVQWFHSVSSQVDVSHSVGLGTWFAAVLGEGQLATVLAWGASVGVVGALVGLWRSAGVPQEIRWSLTAMGVVLLAPHSLFYDAGLAVIALFAGMWHTGRPRFWMAAWAASWLGLAAPMIGFDPLLPLMVAMGVVLWVQDR